MQKTWLSLILLIVTTLILSACTGGVAPTSDSPVTQPTQAPQMTHEADPMSDNSYDVHFIDSTLEHHAGVIAMAEQALKESTTVALKDLAQQTMSTTQAEIDWLKAYRQQNHPKAPLMKDNMDMGMMGIPNDASKPFDQRYAQAMINHHQGSIEMAKEALNQVGHGELRQFAQTMLKTEEAEVLLLQQFLK